MSAGILEDDKGVVFGTTWHGIASYKVQDTPVTSFQAREVLNYPLTKERLFRANGSGVNAYAIVRSDTDKVMVSHVGEGFEVSNNNVMLAFIEEHVLADYPDLQIESVGTLFNGATAFVNLKVNEFQVTGDKSPTVNRLMYCNPLGRGAYQACAHSIRIVCNNTLTAAGAQGEANNTLKKFSHTANAAVRIKDHLIDLSGMYLELTKYKDQLNDLATQTVDVKYFQAYLDAMFPAKDEGRGATLAWAKKEKVKDIFDGEQDLAPTIRTSKYAALQAVMDYYDNHTVIRKADDTMSRSWDGLVGLRAGRKQEALDYLLVH